MVTDTRSVVCKKCKTVGWIEATPLGERNYQKVKCECGKQNHIITRKWGKTIQF